MSDSIREFINGLKREEVDALAYGAVEAIAKMGSEEEWDSETIERVGESLGAGMPEGMPWFGDTSQDRTALNYYRRLMGWDEGEIEDDDAEYNRVVNAPEGRHYARVTHPDGTIKGQPTGNLSWLGAHSYLMGELERRGDIAEDELERISDELDAHNKAEWNGYTMELIHIDEEA